MSEADRLQADLVDAFEDELVAQPGDAAKLDAMIQRALDPGPGGGPEPSPDGGGGGGGMMTIGFSAVVAGIAIVAALVSMPSDEAAREQPVAIARQPEPSRMPEPAAAPTPTADPEPAPEPAPTREVDAPAEHEPAPEAAPATSSSPRPATHPMSAEELLRKANEARRARDYQKAHKLFDRLGREHAGSREEILARVTHGELLLDRMHQPKAALAEFDAYLKEAPSGTLAEEALVGRAQALGQLGRADAEARAWAQLIERFPSSAHAAAAHQRIEALGE